MTALVYTNAFIRHLTGDPPELAERASAYLADADILVLPDLIDDCRTSVVSTTRPPRAARSDPH